MFHGCHGDEQVPLYGMCTVVVVRCRQYASQEIGCEVCVQNDVDCVEHDAK